MGKITDPDVASLEKVKLNQYILKALILIPIFSLTLDIKKDLIQGRNINSIIKGRYRFSKVLQESLSSPNKCYIFRKIIQFKLWGTYTSATSSHTLSLTSHLAMSEKTLSILLLFSQGKQKMTTLGCVEHKKTYILHTSIELGILHVRTAT